eukprot:TRINITY_DN55764_c0_g1_i1.p1 TRINITY_DN55764_c0_g1~~TRINITY_DN55764_c0_g1_i1.p1  ORF type:complete len:376 (+),score=120.26 TRINITY_DN55764_c0_g1_i1:148-1128(+)
MATAAGDCIDLSELLSASVHAAQLAGAVIRAVHRGGALSTQYKDKSDPRTAMTVADTRAQALIVNSLLGRWGGLQIIGEEDIATEPSKGRALRTDLLRDAALGPFPAALRRVPLSDVQLFVDPLDGTREFVEGRLEAVQTLIGIAVRGDAVAGVMGMPFRGPEGHCVYGAVGWGAVGIGKRPSSAPPGRCVLTASKGTKDPVMRGVRDIIAPDHLLEVGATGNKLHKLLTGEAHIMIGHFVTSLWDTCAADALLRSVGGCLTDLCGSPFLYTKKASLANVYGVLGTGPGLSKVYNRTHYELADAIRRSKVMDSVFVSLNNKRRAKL